MLLGLFLFLCVGMVQAQTSLGDTSGTSSLILSEVFLEEVAAKSPDSTKTQTQLKKEEDKPPPFSFKEKNIDFNAAGTRLKGRFVVQERESGVKIGAELSGKAVNGYASIFEGGNFSADAGVNIFGIYSWGTKEGSTKEQRSHWLGFSGGYRQGTYKLTDPDVKSPDEFKDAKLNGFSGFGHYNYFARDEFLLGFSLGVAKLNNYGDLPELKVTRTKSLVKAEDEPSKTESEDSNTPDPTSTVTKEIFTAREGKNYEEFWTASSNLDLLWIPDFPDGTVAVNPFLRFTKHFGRTTDETTISWSAEAGLGFFILAELAENADATETEETPEKSEENLVENGDAVKVKKTTEESTDSESNFLSRITRGVIVQYDIMNNDLKFGLAASYTF